MTTIKRIRLVLTDPSAIAPSTSSASSSSSGAGSSSASAPAPAPESMSTSANSPHVSTAPDADTSSELVQLLQAGIRLTGPLATTATTASSSATGVIPAEAPALSAPSSALASSADAVMAALAGLYHPGVNNSSGNIVTSVASTMHSSSTPAGPPMPSTETGSGTRVIPKKRSSKGKERAVDPLDQQNQQQCQGSQLGATKVKRRRKAVGQDVCGSGSPGTSGGIVGSSSGAQEGAAALTVAGLKKRGRPRKDPTAPPRARRRNAKGNTGKGKGRAKDTTDINNDADANSTRPDSTTDKGTKDNGDSEFETDDDMVEIVSSRITPVQKRKIDVLEDGNHHNQQEEENEFEASSGEGDESEHVGYAGHNQIGMQNVASPLLSPLDAGRTVAVSGQQYTRSLFPTEVLQQILLCLPLSKIARHSRVSKAWLDAARVLPVWKDACKKGELGEPRKKYRTHMALVCANSYWICEQCMSFSKGREHYANLPLPVEDEEDDHLAWMLCLACRIEYFSRHPEPLKEDKIYRDEFSFVVQTKQLAPHSIFINYALRGENLRGVASIGRQDTKRQLFDRGAVQRRALEVHGGWVGVDACATNPGRKRAAVCNERAKECRLYKKKPLTKKRPPVSEEKKEERREALEQRREQRDDARQENWRQKLLWNRVTRLSKRHKWHTTANWRKNRYY
ncbi:hypothetical protein BGZ96_000250 [Linnemannia gamsii]|uniref:F-box domain-containing protein n=1 Tax=Linnemannia gamsii TaxID=64522 RepID=A0ABQ7JQ25_9FUNG|nr:hypothetical protein BGZ96_000250 [Linnemannia gamsii]